jgi:hypothetical protein
MTIVVAHLASKLASLARGEAPAVGNWSNDGSLQTLNL